MALRPPFAMPGSLLCLLVGTLLLTACTLPIPGLPAPTPEVEEPITLTLWHTATPQEAQTLQRIADAWSRQQTRPVSIRLVAQAGEISLHEELLASIQTQTTPDLAFVRPGDLADYGDTDELIPLNRLWQGLDKETQADYIETFFEAARCPSEESKTLLAWPVHQYETALYVNMDAVEEMGAKKAPETWTDFKEQCTAHTTATEYACMAAFPTADMATLLFWSHNNPIVDVEAQKATLTDSSALAALSELNDLRSANGVQLSAAYDGYVLDFTKGRTLFSIDRTDRLDEYESAIGDDFEWTVVPIPSDGDASHTLIRGGTIAIFRSDAEREALAADFLQYLTRPDVNERWAAAMDAFPVRQSALDHMLSLKPDTHFAEAAALLDNAQSVPCVRNWDAIEASLAQAITNTLNGTSSPETALTASAQLADNVLR